MMWSPQEETMAQEAKSIFTALSALQEDSRLTGRLSFRVLESLEVKKSSGAVLKHLKEKENVEPKTLEEFFYFLVESFVATNTLEKDLKGEYGDAVTELFQPKKPEAPEGEGIDVPSGRRAVRTKAKKRTKK
jgi:hypothetical protein